MDRYDLESGFRDGEKWLLSEAIDDDLRRGFTRKVLGILSVQLILTTVISVPFVTSPAVLSFVAHNPWIQIVSLVVFIVSFCMISCCRSLARTYPWNYLLLLAFTLAQGVLCGLISASYHTTSVALALVITAVTVTILTAIAIFSKIDFTKWGSYLFVGSLVLLFSGIILAFLPGVPLAHKLYAWGGAALFSVYLMYHIQLIVGGKHHQHEFSVDDYCFAALTVYLDVMNLFFYILSIVGDRR